MTDSRLDLACPVCGADASASPADCPACGVPLADFRRVREAPLAWFNLALRRWACGEVGGASRAATAAVALHPGHVPSRLLLARLLARLEDYTEALEHAGHAVEIAPGSAEAEALYEALWRVKFLPESAGGEREVGA